MEHLGCMAALRVATETAEDFGIRIVAVILDPSGLTTGLIRMQGTFLASLDYAQSKAWTAASFSVSSSEFGDLLDQQSPAIREGLSAHARVTRLPGGAPVFQEGQLVAAVGVSGGSGEQDEACALAMVGVLGQVSR